MRHNHLYTIADDDAVKTLVNKLSIRGHLQQRREKLFQALEKASKGYAAATQRERKAFFHGLMTGYAVALKLW